MKARYFILLLLVGIAIAAAVTVSLQRQIFGPSAPANWQQRLWVSAAAERQPQPVGAKEWMYAVFALEPRGDDQFHASGVATIIYPEQVVEQRIWWGIAEIGEKGATFSDFELGPVVPSKD